MQKKLIILLLSVLLPMLGMTQNSTAATFLNLNPSARSAALGTSFLAVNDDDISLSFTNPSLINSGLNNDAMLAFVNHFSGANYGLLGIGKELKGYGNFVFGMQYVNYGKFDRYTEDDNYEGSFTASDFMFIVGWGKKLWRDIDMGVSFKPSLSHYDTYTSLAVAFDIAVSYHSPSTLFSTTLIARNIGAQLYTFAGTTEALPFEIAWGMSYKLPKAPFRLYFTATELQRWNLRYDDEYNPTDVVDPFTGEVIKENVFTGLLDNAFRHAVVGVEFCPSKAFNIRLGYNYRKREEMYGIQSFNFSGFSYGVGLRVKKFNISYSRNNYHLGQAPNYITITTDLSDYFN